MLRKFELGMILNRKDRNKKKEYSARKKGQKLKIKCFKSQIVFLRVEFIVVNI